MRNDIVKSVRAAKTANRMDRLSSAATIESTRQPTPPASKRFSRVRQVRSHTGPPLRAASAPRFRSASFPRSSSSSKSATGQSLEKKLGKLKKFNEAAQEPLTFNLEASVRASPTCPTGPTTRTHPSATKRTALLHSRDALGGPGWMWKSPARVTAVKKTSRAEGALLGWFRHDNREAEPKAPPVSKPKSALVGQDGMPMNELSNSEEYPPLRV